MQFCRFQQLHGARQRLEFFLLFGIAHLQRFKRAAGSLHRSIGVGIGGTRRLVPGIGIQHGKMILAFQQL